MSRQEKRAEKRAEAKALTKKLAPSVAGPIDPLAPKTMRELQLDDRKVRGTLLYRAFLVDPTALVLLHEQCTMFPSKRDQTRFHSVTRERRNKRGTLVWDYRCNCRDFLKDGQTDCEHIFCERLRHREIDVIGEISPARAKSARAVRQPARKRKTATGQSIKTTQRKAREQMPTEVPRLVLSLKQKYDRDQAALLQNVAELSIRKAGGQLTQDSIRASALVYKIARKKSYDEMKCVYEDLIAKGLLRLERPPHQNSVSAWMNDPLLTPILRRLLYFTSLPFRARETAAIIDSTKFSQMSTARSRGVEYDGDSRLGADWIKCHTLVGVETMIVMAVNFSGVRGPGTHDVNFVKPLIAEAAKTFPLQALLADKAYFSEPHLDWLWNEYNIKAFIPVKKNITARTKGEHYVFEPMTELIQMQDGHQRDFHDVYRYRSKIEGFFSILKRMAGEHCWSHGRPRDERNGDDPSVAWQNELLCKFIYMNLRTTVSLQTETGYYMDYAIADRFFPPAFEPLLAA